MAYATANFKLHKGGLSGAACMNEWVLDSVDAIADINTAAYVSDGYTKGARKGDLVHVRIWDTVGTGTVSAYHLCWVIAVTSPSIDLTDGLAVTATDTD